MHMQKTKKIVLMIATVLFVLLAIRFVSTRVYSFAGNRIMSVSMRKHTFHAEVVSGKEKMQKGLGDRSGLCDACGMLFEFEKNEVYSFWMKSMQFPLDIIWIRENKIVHIEKNVQPSFAGIFAPEETADKVLEVDAGSVEKLGIEVGDSVSL